MKIAMAATGKDEDSDISPVAGRAPFYLVFEDKKLVKAIENPFRFGGGGAGYGVAQMLANEGVEKVYSGQFGMNMQMSFKEKGIKFENASGAVKDILK